MTTEEYIDKTRPAANFLMHVFDLDSIAVASIAVAQGDRNTQVLIDMLEMVKNQAEDWLKELKALEE